MMPKDLEDQANLYFIDDVYENEVTEEGREIHEKLDSYELLCNKCTDLEAVVNLSVEHTLQLLE